MPSAKLGDILTLKRGYDLPKARRLDGPVPIVSSSGITGFHNEPKVSGPGVVTGRYGTIGEVFFVEGDYWPLNTALYVQDFKNHNPRFVYYYLKNILKGTQSDKAAVPGVNRNDLHARVVNIPPESQHQKIVSILSAYDDLIENNRRRIHLLEEAARLLYREWFVYLRFPGHEHVPVHDGVPEAWGPVEISGLGEVITGKTPSTKNPDNYGSDIPFIKTPDIHGTPIVVFPSQYLSRQGADSQKNKYLSSGSIMVSCIGTVGAVAMNSSEAQTNQQINTIVPFSENLQFYTYFAARELKPLLEAMGGGATMTNVNKGKFESMEILLPCAELLDIFDRFCRPHFSMIENLLLQNYHLAEARDLLLPRLMNGEIPV